MASLFNTKISNTYVGLLKLSDNLVLSSTLREISDGSGNGAGVFLNTNGDLKASGILEFGSLKDTGESITISKFVDEADGIANNDNDTSIPTSAAIVDYVAARITLEDLDFSGDSGTGSVDLDSQVFAIVGTANEIETSAGSQQLQIGLPSNVTISNNLQVNGLLKGNNNIVIKDTSDRTMAAFYGGNKSELYFNNSKKLETTSDGTTITGGLTATASSSFTSASFSGTITGVANLSDGSTAVTQSINDGSTKIATTAYVDASVDTVDTLSEILAVGNTTGGTNIAVSANDDITFTDTSKAIFGDANDLQIYHTANSFIYNTTGDLILEQTVNDQDIVFKSDDGSGGTAEYFKLSGSIVKTVFSKNTIHEDNVIGEYGSDGDLQVYHNGSNAFIENNTGALNISQKLDDGIIKFNSDDGSGGTTRYIQIDGSVEKTFFFKNSRHEDNVKAEFGSSGDLEIYHDGSNSHIDDTGTGNLVLRGNGAVSIQKYTGENLGMFNADGSVDLFHDDSKKFETTSTGVTITGVAVADGLQIGDDETIQLGDSQEFSLTHTASGNSIISETGSGNLFIDATNFRVRNSTAGGEDMISADSDGSVTLYNNNASKLTTSSTGVTVTGVTVTNGINSSAEIDVNLASEGKYFEGGSGSLRRLSITSGTNVSAHALHTFNINSSNGKYKFDISGTEAFSIDASNASLGGNLTIAGDLTVNGTTTTVNTQTLAVEDPLISLAKDNSANSVDIGFYGRYNDGSDKYLGLFADASDSSTFKLFKGTGTEPTTTVDTTASGFAYADLDIGTTLGLTTHGGGWFMEDTTFMKTVNNKSLFGTGNVHMTSFVSVVDSTYFLTPAESTTSLNVAGNISLAVAGKKLISDFSSGGTTRKTELTLYNSSDGAFILNNEHSSTGGIQFQIDGSDAFTIAKSGNISTFSGNVNVDADLKVRGASGEDHFVIAPQAAGSGTILISYNGAETGYEPLVIDAENFTFRHSGTPIISTSGTTTTLAGNLSSTASTVHFSLANMSAYQLNGTYIVDSSRNLVNIGNFTGAGSIKSTLNINNSTLPDVPSEHVILLNPPTTTGYYGGGISWSEGTNTAASLGVYDDGTGGALGLYFATGSNTSISQRMKINSSGKVTIGQVDNEGNGHLNIGDESPTIQLFDTTNDAKLLIYTQDNNSIIGTYSNNPMSFFTDSTEAIVIGTDQAASFKGVIGAHSVGSDKQMQFQRTGGDTISIEHDASRLYYYNETDTAVLLSLGFANRVGINSVSPAEQLTIKITESGTTQATAGGILLSNTDSTANNLAAITFGHSESGSGSHTKIGAIYEDRTSGSEDTSLFFGTLGGGSYAERLRISSTGNFIFRNVTSLDAPTSGYLKEMFIANVDGVGTFATNGESNGLYGSFNFKTRKGDSSDPLNLITMDNTKLTFHRPAEFDGVVTFEANTTYLDSVRARFGTDADAAIEHNGSHLFIDNTKGTSYIRNTGANSAGIIIRNDDAGDIHLDNDFAGNIIFSTSATNRMTLDSTGELKVNKSIHLGDDSSVLTPAQYSMLFEAPSGTSTNINMYTLGSSVFNISADGTQAKIGWGSSQNREVNFVNTGAGNIAIGIGTETPQVDLHIEGVATSPSSSQLLVCGASDTVGHTAGILLRAESGEDDSALRAKGGIFFEREAANGLGALHLCNNNSNNNDSADLTDAKLTIQQDGYVHIEQGIFGKSYAQTSSGSVTSIIDTNIPVAAGVWEVFYMGNPNNGGSGAYRAITTGYIIVTVDFTHPNVVNEIRFETTSITGGGHGNIQLPIAAKILQGGSEYDELDYNTSGQTIRLKVTGWVGDKGANQVCRITQRLNTNS